MKLATIVIETDGGPWVSHNYPCPISRRHYAVFNMDGGYFEPSWEAQKDGWHIVKADNWWKRLLMKVLKAR